MSELYRKVTCVICLDDMGEWVVTNCGTCDSKGYLYDLVKPCEHGKIDECCDECNPSDYGLPETSHIHTIGGQHIHPYGSTPHAHQLITISDHSALVRWQQPWGPLSS